MRITEQRRKENEDRIRAAADRLLRGELPPGGKCDVKTLAAEAGVTRAAIYSTYLHLKEDFERRRDNLRASGETPDPREAQIVRLRQRVATLQGRIAKQDNEITELAAFRTLAVSRLAAQQEEIARLRGAATDHSNVRVLAALPETNHGDREIFVGQHDEHMCRAKETGCSSLHM